MEPNEKKFNWKRSLITICIVLLTSAAVGGAVWYVMDQQVKKDAEAKKTELEVMQKQIDELKTKSTSTATPATTTTTSPDWHNYSNSKYGFSITLSDFMKDYTVTENSSGTYGATNLNSYQFKLPTIDSQYTSTGNNPATVFLVMVFTESEWQKETAQEGPHAQLLGRKGNYVFGYNLASQWPSDWNSSRGITTTNLQTMLATFK
jgi:hypothetical protein